MLLFKQLLMSLTPSLIFLVLILGCKRLPDNALLERKARVILEKSLHFQADHHRRRRLIIFRWYHECS